MSNELIHFWHQFYHDKGNIGYKKWIIFCNQSVYYNQTEIYLCMKIVIEHPPNMYFELFQIVMLCLMLFFFFYV